MTLLDIVNNYILCSDIFYAEWTSNESTICGNLDYYIVFGIILSWADMLYER